jgi:plastocyanin
MRRLVSGALVVAAGLGLTGGVSAAAGRGHPAKVQVIVIKSLAFRPAAADLQVGQAVEWDNEDIFQHSATAKDGSFNVELPPHSKKRIVLRRAGRVAYYCRYHPGMTGVLQVRP